MVRQSARILATPHPLAPVPHLGRKMTVEVRGELVEDLDISGYTRGDLYQIIQNLDACIAEASSELAGLTKETQALLQQKAALTEYVANIVQKFHPK